MTDSERLSTRLDRAAGRRPADPAPLKADAQKIVTWALGNVNNPEKKRLATDEEMEAAEKRIRLERLERKAEIMMSRLPSRYRDARYEDLPSSAGVHARRWVQGYRAGERKSLVIMGTVGTGKTWMAAAIARDLMLHDSAPVPTDFITVADALAAMRTYRPGLEVDMIRFSAAPVLVLDDLGQENRTDWTGEQLYRLSHSRYHNGLPTIVTTNLTGDEIKKTYESRTVERLFGGAARIDLLGHSLREMPF